MNKWKGHGWRSRPVDQRRYVRFGSTLDLLDNLIRPRQHRMGDREPQRLDGFAVDHEVELGWLLDRHLSRPSTIEDPVYVAGGSSVDFLHVGRVRHETTRIHIRAGVVHRRQSVLSGELHDDRKFA